MRGLAFFRDEKIIRDDHGQLRCRFAVVPHTRREQEVDVVFALGWVELQEAPVDAGGSLLRDAGRLDELHVQLPHTGVLHDWQSLKRTVEGAAGLCQSPLPHQKSAVLEPNARVLVHEDEGSLECVVDNCVSRRVAAFSFHLPLTVHEVRIPSESNQQDRIYHQACVFTNKAGLMFATTRVRVRSSPTQAYHIL